MPATYSYAHVIGVMTYSSSSISAIERCKLRGAVYCTRMAGWLAGWLLAHTCLSCLYAIHNSRDDVHTIYTS